jgi:hypothetical protein
MTPTTAAAPAKAASRRRGGGIFVALVPWVLFTFLAAYARAIAGGVLAAIAFGSLLFTPFTEQYARESAPRDVWDSPRFRAVNRRLTTMWASVFAAMVPLHLLAGAVDTQRAKLLLNWAIPVLMVVWAAKRTGTIADAQSTPTPVLP